MALSLSGVAKICGIQQYQLVFNLHLWCLCFTAFNDQVGSDHSTCRSKSFGSVRVMSGWVHGSAAAGTRIKL